MRKLILLVMLFMTVATTMAQLNTQAETVKQEFPETYSKIRKGAVDKWDSNHKMIVYEINGQCEAYFKLGDYIQRLDYDKELMLDAIVKWSEDGIVNYKMVIYTYKNQIKAKGVY